MSRGLRLRGHVLLGAAFLALAAPAGAASLSVKYRSATSVYLDGGRAHGLSVGDRLNVVSGRSSVGQLEVVYVAEQSASCRVVAESRPIRAGDLVEPPRKGATGASATPAPAPAPETVTTTRPAAPLVADVPRLSPSNPRPLARVRGGLSAGYYRVWDSSPAAADFEQRTGRLDLSLWDIGGHPLSLNARFRTRQDVRSRRLTTLAPRDQRLDRLYELSLRYEAAGGGLAYEVGRIGVSQFVGIGYLDGVLGQLGLAGRLRVGGFFGRRAEVDGLGFAGGGLKYGGFVRLAPAGRYASAGGEALLALVREFSQEEISREYLALETRLQGGRRVVLFQRAEVDLNRGWRRDLAGRAYQLSSLSTYLDYRFSPGAHFTLSYDSRRNYRDHFNRSVAQALFDEALHQGLRGSLNFGSARVLSVTAGGGVRFGGREAGGSAWSWNASLRRDDLLFRDFALTADGAGFWNGFTRGYQAASRLERRLGPGSQVDLGYGRSSYRLLTTGQDRRTEWLRFTGRGDLGRGVYLTGDLEYDRGDDLRGPRALLELGWLF